MALEHKQGPEHEPVRTLYLQRSLKTGRGGFSDLCIKIPRYLVFWKV